MICALADSPFSCDSFFLCLSGPEEDFQLALSDLDPDDSLVAEGGLFEELRRC